ncbi:bifunctional (p)ppGpp synthetase/guanosine-3',5'-bis(diphosphate) 3'-pyrophosphohydrolase [Cysteiniphilum sp. QT6929]|uniref:RelA/SpoT family protein n=1 Tax=Cysteiniphilum sp. QT6929 TaxID=2975055 RepID=UPI0024B3AA0D|nr:bifunctional (p)ppGpp synthetase/guanosine-3',5'-bis(diphosphate) 3'-pyrophosphohydrolase [Cysteiniphilum sp. QT6929]WHN64743.1 bifunctional (p)ppGpp synthetase/guanosine-3',5'-bis(diphosphate) 3'-pyrophosphohydrolase [Cysteiniphilum sp. QT6929]
MFLFYKLNKIIHSYLNDEQRALVADAFLFGADAHELQVRSSGEPYFTHPVAVACVLAGMRLDCETVIAALLHDTIEDTDVSSEIIAKRYGEKTAQLVEGVTKLSKIETHSKAELQAENFRKMVLAMVQDIRVILIKLADRLHNMTTLAPLRPDKRRRIALETLEIYAPIAHRLGMHHIKNSFEELAFEAMYPYRYKTLKTKVLHAQKHRDRLFRKIMERLQHHLAELLESEQLVSGRKKRLYSIYRKMRDKEMSFSEIMDIYAYKVIAPTRRECYMILGAIHEIFRPIPGRFKDYIATPKANGYQSLHTTVFGPYGVPIEVQIKTKMMDDTAEKGVAAHWIYKAKSLSHDNAQKWLEKLSDLQQNVTKSTDFVESVKLDLFPDEVYVFTPNGEIIELPKSATCVDFAYHIHTDIGNHCIAAKVNRRITPLSYVLTHGDTVEIITSPNAHPNPAWLEFIKTARAKHAIKHALKRHEHEEFVHIGQQILTQALLKNHMDFSTISAELLQEALVEFNFPGIAELHAAIGQAHFSANTFVRFVEQKQQLESDGYDSQRKLLIDDSYLRQLAGCCTPIPDDPIIGVLISDKGLMIHRIKCNELLKLKKTHEIIETQWAKDCTGYYPVKLRVSLQNVQGAIAKVTANISRHDAQILSFNILESDAQYGIVQTMIEVKDRVHLAHVIRGLKHLKICLKIERI